MGRQGRGAPRGRRTYLALACAGVAALAVAAAVAAVTATQQDPDTDRGDARAGSEDPDFDEQGGAGDGGARTGQNGGGPDPTAQDSITVDAKYYAKNKTAVIRYSDKTGANAPVAVEVLGMRESYREIFSGPEFSIMVGFESVPRHGWAVHPVVAEVDHPAFGGIQIKTEIRDEGQPAPRTIYAEK